MGTEEKGKKWYKSLTFWTAVTSIAGTVAGMATGTIDSATGMQTIVGCVIAIFLRKGIGTPIH